MNRKIRLGFWICALFVTTGGIYLILQHNTTPELRHEAEASTPASLQPAPVENVDPQGPPPIPANPPAMEVASASEIRRADPVSTALLQNLSNKVQALQQENERLAAELRVSQPAQPEPQTIPTESPKTASAYVGPGTWVPASSDPPQGRFDRIVISRLGNGDAMSLKLGDRPEVPFHMLKFYSSTPAFAMGVAAYEYEESSLYLVVTFQPDGLKVDVLRPSSSPRQHSFRTVEKMVRIN